MSDILTAEQLAQVPGVDAAQDVLEYAARRASDAVAHYWAPVVDPVPEWVTDIAADVAIGYLDTLTRPRGVTSMTRSVDDASRTVRFDEHGTGTQLAAFELTDTQIARLRPARVKGSRSIRLGVPGYPACP